MTKIPQRAPRTHAERMRLSNCFKGWDLAFSVCDRLIGVPPSKWPPNFWWECECYDKEMSE
jgi:hypothetical protein